VSTKTADLTRGDSPSRKAAIAVALIGLVLVGIPAIEHAGDIFTNPYAERTATTTVTKTTGGGSTGKPVTTETTQTQAPVHDSLLERSVAGGAILLLQLGMVALAAFLAGAVVQRIWVARYGIKVAGLEFPELSDAAEASKNAIALLRDSLDNQAKKVDELERAKQLHDAQIEAVANATLGAIDELQGLTQRVARLER
jgi:hypothetical protein